MEWREKTLSVEKKQEKRRILIKSEILVCSFFYCQRQNHKSVGMEKNAFSVPVDFVTFDPEGTTKKPKTPSPWLKKIQHIIQIYMLSHMNLIFRLRHIIKQKFKNQCTSKPASFNLKIRKSHWHVNILYIIHTDESGIFHCLGKAVTVTAIRRSTVKLRGRISEILPADGFITSLSVLTAEPAAFIAQEFYFIFLVLRHQV